MTPQLVPELRQKYYNATAFQIHKVSPDLLLMRVRPDVRSPPHKPGQYGTLGLGFWEPRIPGCHEERLQPGEESKLARRAYSISCPLVDRGGRLLDKYGEEWLEFYIVLVRETEKAESPALTPRLFLLQEGDRLYMGEKVTGRYTLDPVKPEDTILFLSTGTGEAPHNYMLWDLLRRGHRGRILAACCVRRQIDLGYAETHASLAKHYPNYTYVSLTTREPDVPKVYIQDLIRSGQLEKTLGQRLDPAQSHVFLCGNPAMIGIPSRDPNGQPVYPQPAGVIEILEERGFRVDQPRLKVVGNIHVEEYW